MRKFFVSNEQIKDSIIEILGDDVNHIKNVLRLENGEIIKICDKDNSLNYVSKIVDISKSSVICEILEEVKNESEGNVQITIFQGLPKSDKMELIIQKGTELGVYNFIPVSFDRSIVKLSGKDEVKKIERWQKISEVAAKQSGRDIVPNIGKIVKVKDICDLIKDYDVVLVAYELENNNFLKEELTKIESKENIKIGIVIGPEGGIEESEIETLKEAGAKIITLGKRILRTETVCLMMTSIIMYELEK